MKKIIQKFSFIYCIVYTATLTLLLVLPIRLFIETPYLITIKTVIASSGFCAAIIVAVNSAGNKKFKNLFITATLVTSLITGLYVWITNDLVYDSITVCKSPVSEKQVVVNAYYLFGIPRAQLYSYHFGFLLIKEDSFVMNTMNSYLNTPDYEWSEDDNLTVTFHTTSSVTDTVTDIRLSLK